MVTTNCSFERNVASGDGGAMRLSYGSAAGVNLCRFTGNKGEYLVLQGTIVNRTK